MKVKVGVLSAGGDCAGINSAIRWMVNSALDKDLIPTRGVMFDIIGIRDGFQGLIEMKGDKKESVKRWTVTLDNSVVRTWDRYGGTRLGTSRINPFNPKKDQSGLVLENCKKLGLDALVVIGGFDSLGVAYSLFREGIRVIGVPKTIDRDLSGRTTPLGLILP